MKTIVVGVPTDAYAKHEYLCCLDELHRKKIFIRRASFNGAAIDTLNCRIIFVPKNIKSKVRGLRSDVCFGFSEEEQCLLNASNKPTDYKGTFLEYVYEVEGIKE